MEFALSLGEEGITVSQALVCLTSCLFCLCACFHPNTCRALRGWWEVSALSTASSLASQSVLNFLFCEIYCPLVHLSKDILSIYIVLCPYSSIYQSGEQRYIFSAFSTMKINKTYNFPCSIVSKVSVSKVTRSESDSGRLTRKRTGGPQSVRYIYTTLMNGYMALDTELCYI